MKNASDKLFSLFLSFIFILGLSACGGGSGSGTTPAAPIDLWTWMSGSDVGDQSGVYTSATPADVVPGGRRGGASWTDSSGNLWLFGGYDQVFYYNDLWKYDGTNWSWIGGSNLGNQLGEYSGANVADNIPGARNRGVSWMDSNGDFWLFGGTGYASTGMTGVGFLNDLWKFDSTNWTWMSGSDVVNQAGNYGTKGAAAGTNVPGARRDSVSWIDSSGNLWLFGGEGLDASGTQGYLNDLWKYDGANWTWVSGSDLVSQSGTYGTQGTADPTNVPGARGFSVSWTDSSGNLWLFGGLGYDSAGDLDILNDLWKYDGANWIWVSGSDVVGQPGVYGTQGTAADTNVPGARYGSISWTDSSGSFWLFGGDTFDAGPLLNDLWKFDGSNWIWMSGSNLTNQAGDYGIQGTAVSTNVPGTRGYGTRWIDSNNSLWLFGGYGHDSTGTRGCLNDLWRYQP